MMHVTSLRAVRLCCYSKRLTSNSALDYAVQGSSRHLLVTIWQSRTTLASMMQGSITPVAALPSNLTGTFWGEAPGTKRKERRAMQLHSIRNQPCHTSKPRFPFYQIRLHACQNWRQSRSCSTSMTPVFKIIHAGCASRMHWMTLDSSSASWCIIISLSTSASLSAYFGHPWRQGLLAFHWSKRWFPTYLVQRNRLQAVISLNIYSKSCSVSHSLVLVLLQPTRDIDFAILLITHNCNPRKWATPLPCTLHSHLCWQICICEITWRRNCAVCFSPPLTSENRNSSQVPPVLLKSEIASSEPSVWVHSSEALSHAQASRTNSWEQTRNPGDPHSSFYITSYWFVQQLERSDSI